MEHQKFRNVSFMQNSATWRSQILLIMIYCLYHRIIMTYHFSSQSAQFCKPVRSLVWGPLGYISHTFHCVYSPSEAGPWSYSIFFISLKLFTRPVLKAGQAFTDFFLQSNVRSCPSTLMTAFSHDVNHISALQVIVYLSFYTSFIYFF